MKVWWMIVRINMFSAYWAKFSDTNTLFHKYLYKKSSEY